MKHPGNRWIPRAMATAARLLAMTGIFGCGELVADTDGQSDSEIGGNETEAPSTDTESDTLSPCLSVTDPAAFQADTQALFDYDHVPTFDLYLPQAAWETLQENAMDEEYTEAEACFEGRRIGTVGLRFKGSYGTLYACFDDQGEMICPRMSLKLKFDEYVDDQRFFGLKRLNFNANRQDDSRMKERLAYDLYRSMGIVAPRSAWAVVRVNGQSYGLYGMVEQVDGRFTDDRWPDNPDGDLYKELWPTDTNRTAIVSALRTNEEVSDGSGFAAFSEAFTAAMDDADLRRILGEYTDLDAWDRYMAVDEAVLSYDGITYFWTDGSSFHNHNYFIYEDAPLHFTLIPWDVESTFWINPDHAAPHWTKLPDDCAQTYPYWDGLALAPGCDLVFRALNTNRTGWREAARELLDGPFAEETMIAEIDRIAAFIGDEARAPETPNMYTTFDDAVLGMKNVIPQLRTRLEKLIAETE